MARHAAEDAENIVDDEAMEVEDMRRKRRDAEPVVIPTHANVLPTTYHHLAGAYPIYQTSVYNPYLSYPLHQVQHKFFVKVAKKTFSKQVAQKIHPMHGLTITIPCTSFYQ